jgi:hypothetical protein
MRNIMRVVRAWILSNTYKLSEEYPLQPEHDHSHDLSAVLRRSMPLSYESGVEPGPWGIPMWALCAIGVGLALIGRVVL